MKSIRITKNQNIMSYLENKARLDNTIQEFLDGRGIGRYTDEAHMRSALAAKLRERGDYGGW
jgi:hypothetical protein